MELNMADKWEYRVVYVDPRGRISSEGVEFVRQSGENRTAFMSRYLDTLGADGWELVGVHPLIRTESSYVILKRPAADAHTSDASAA
jgi:hypothetical protein